MVPAPGKEATMSYRPFVRVLWLVVLAAGAAAALEGKGAPRPDADAGREQAAPVRLIVQNRSYSALQVLMREEGGRERRLGQAPPEFTNTLFIPEPLPDGPVRFVARLPGEPENLHMSAPIRLVAGARVTWRLPDNVLER